MIYTEMMGNPFVDSSVSGICEWLDLDQPNEIDLEDLEELIEEVAPLMQKPPEKSKPGWNNLYSIFPNSVLVNPSYKNKNRVLLLSDLCHSYLSQIEPLGTMGNCLGCGRRDSKNILLDRSNIPLTGSGALLNFFPSFQQGIGYCGACALAVQFLPLSLVATSGQFLMLHANRWLAQRYWSRSCVEDVQRQYSRQEMSGCYNPGYPNKKNALFFMAQEMISYEEENELENLSLTIYDFSNYGQEPKLDLYQIPSKLFNFLRYCYQSQFKSDWLNIVRSGYQKVDWGKVESEDDYKNKRNFVFERLLRQKSILGFFLNRKEKNVRASWSLLSIYLQEVRGMELTRIEAIQRIGDSIAETIRQSGRDRRLGQLERSKTYAECRNILRFLIQDRIAQGQSEPLFTLKDYVEYLFPDTGQEFTSWRESRDLLLFHLYSQLHDWLIEKDYVSDSDVIEADYTEDE